MPRPKLINLQVDDKGRKEDTILRGIGGWVKRGNMFCP